MYRQKSTLFRYMRCTYGCTPTKRIFSNKQHIHVEVDGLSQRTHDEPVAYGAPRLGDVCGITEGGVCELAPRGEDGCLAEDVYDVRHVGVGAVDGAHEVE